MLVVEDNHRLRSVLKTLILRLSDTEVVEAEDLAEARRHLDQSVDAMVLDVRLRDGDGREGFELLRELRSTGRTPPTIVVTSSNDAADVREALRLGARDYILKDELSTGVLESLLDDLREPAPSRIQRTDGLGELLGGSPPMEQLRQVLARVADSPATVLVRGETGVGKGLVARALHRASLRAREPFVVVHCAALPANLVESTLFGHERGAFTGAERRVRGQLDLAGSGTVFLDEIAELPLELQAKLLHVLDDRRYRPLGSEKEQTLRARIVAATHVDLAQRVREGSFRADLYHRLSVLQVDVPPLAARAGDVAVLVEAFAAAQPRALTFTPEALAWLARRAWPGNVRELANVVERLAVLADEPTIDVTTLEQLVPPTEVEGEAVDDAVLALLNAPTPKGQSRLVAAESRLLRAALEACDGNKSAAARLLGLERKALQRRLERDRRSG